MRNMRQTYRWVLSPTTEKMGAIYELQQNEPRHKEAYRQSAQK